MSELTKFKEKFQIPELTIREYRHWTWSLRPTQPTLCATVLSIRREAAHFSDVTPDELAELATAVKELESRIKAAFTYDKINYLMLMMVDPQVHFHVIPRYATPRDFAGTTWTDANWPRPPDIGGTAITDGVTRALKTTLG